MGWHACMFSKALFDLWIQPAILDIVESITGPEIQINGDFWIRPKLPAEEITTAPWHQDSGYMPDTAHNLLPAVWFPLVPVDARNGALQFVPGTHKLGVQVYHKEEGAVFSTTDFAPQPHEIETLDMMPGDLIIFHNLVFHRSTLNMADMVRWSVDFRYSRTGTPVEHMWHGGMCFAGRSDDDPASVADWAQVQSQWAASDQKDEFP